MSIHAFNFFVNAGAWMEELSDPFYADSIEALVRQLEKSNVVQTWRKNQNTTAHLQLRCYIATGIARKEGLTLTGNPCEIGKDNPGDLNKWAAEAWQAALDADHANLGFTCICLKS